MKGKMPIDLVNDDAIDGPGKMDNDKQPYSANGSTADSIGHHEQVCCIIFSTLIILIFFSITLYIFYVKKNN